MREADDILEPGLDNHESSRIGGRVCVCMCVKASRAKGRNKGPLFSNSHFSLVAYWIDPSLFLHITLSSRE